MQKHPQVLVWRSFRNETLQHAAPSLQTHLKIRIIQCVLYRIFDSFTCWWLGEAAQLTPCYHHPCWNVYVLPPMVLPFLFGGNRWHCIINFGCISFLSVRALFPAFFSHSFFLVFVMFFQGQLLFTFPTWFTHASMNLLHFLLQHLALQPCARCCRRSHQATQNYVLVAAPKNTQGVAGISCVYHVCTMFFACKKEKF